MITPEELLKPRIQLTLLVPFCLDQVGKVYTESSRPGYILFMEKYLSFAWFEKYPHLFRELKWWELREEEDMPKYLKFRHGGVAESEAFMRHLLLNSMWANANNPMPATEQEYNDFINKG